MSASFQDTAVQPETFEALETPNLLEAEEGRVDTMARTTLVEEFASPGLGCWRRHGGSIKGLDRRSVADPPIMPKRRHVCLYISL